MATKAAPKLEKKSAIAKIARQPAVGAADFISMSDLSPSEFAGALALAEVVKCRPADFQNALAGKQIVLIFEKPSLRTRVTFQAGMAALGGMAHFLDSRDERIDQREPLRDIARNLERWLDGIVLRTFAH